MANVPAECKRAAARKWSKANAEAVARMKRESKRRRALIFLAQGLTWDGDQRRRQIKPRPKTGFDIDDATWDRIAERNAIQAWRWFLKQRVSDEWMRGYYQATGKPWNNPRLTDAEAYTLRYSLDAAFAARERQRTTGYRHRHPQYALRWSGHDRRWELAVSSHDGSVDQETIRYLRSIPECAYCGEPIPHDDRHFDHVTPLSKLGRHSADNLIAACGACNRAKSAKSLIAFVFPWLGVLPKTNHAFRVIRPGHISTFPDAEVSAA